MLIIWTERLIRKNLFLNSSLRMTSFVLVFWFVRFLVFFFRVGWRGVFLGRGAQESIKTMEMIVLNIVHFILIANYNGLISIPMQWICRTSQIFHLQFNFPENKSICKWSVKSTPVIHVCYQRLMFVNQSKTHTYNNWKKLKGCSW